MKWNYIPYVALLGLGFVIASAQSAPNGAFKGEIMDNQCASLGSHDKMMKKTGTTDARDCTLACMKMGDKFVLYDAGTQTIYQLSDQSKAKNFAGQKVEVKGNYNPSSRIIKVQEIQPFSR